MKSNHNNKKYFKPSILFNPLAILIYGIACYYIVELAEYGGVTRRLPIILLTSGLLLIWLLWFLYYSRKESFKQKINSQKTNVFLNAVSKPWFYIALITLLLITGSAGFNIYNSAQPFHGKLSWVIQDIKTRRNVPFEKKNIYTDGLYGFLKDMDVSLELPDELYLTDYFSIFFDPDGTITSISGTIYGFNKGNTDERKSFRINYDEDDSDEMMIRVDSHSNAGNENTQDVRLETLFDALSHLSLQENVGQWPNESNFELYYSGMRDFGYNDEGIIYYNQEKVLGIPEIIHNPIVGYTLSIYPPDNESITPNRFVYTEFEDLEQLSIPLQSDEPLYDVADESIVNDSVAYQLVILDAALGSRFYGLTKTGDDVENSEVLINPDPFLGETGVASGITFINESLGFIGLSHSGGIQADLFRTDDGGVTFEKLNIPPREVPMPLNENLSYSPFDFPGMPFEENRKLVLHIGQGADGDHNRGSQAVYHSMDNGKSWVYIEELIE